MSQHALIIAAGVLRQGDELLLVYEQGSHDVAPFWALPGGRAEAGELVSETLIREVREETGLEVVSVGRLLYATQHMFPAGHSQVAPNLPDVGADVGASAQSIAFVFAVNAWQGALRPADPDDLIVGARFWPLRDALAALEVAPWRVMSEPLLACLRGEASPGAIWCYVRQPDGSDSLIERTE